jgi:peptidoglycan/LPS O-acetylase OafA/YrhL
VGKSPYRPDIDGLRAVAVVAVVLFHYGVPGVPGGFVGVDVFFVISGYLITAKLVEAWPTARTGRSLLAWLGAFYRRRILRIAPAMLVLIALALAAGWFILAPGDYAELGRSAAWSAVGLGNVFFYLNTGYFDAAADTMPLLHLWSLGVEEQFYLAWPIVVAGVLALTRVNPRRAGWVILILVAGGFIASLWLVSDDPKAAFFLPFARAWELGLGAVLVFAPPIAARRLSEIAVLAGLALIAWASATLTAEDTFPGLNALAPCLGAALVIWPRAVRSRAATALGVLPLRLVGQMSYSLYLWHWPVLVLFRHYLNGAWPSPTELVALAGASLLLAWLSWRHVEQPVRRLRLRPIPLAAGWGAAVSAVAAVGMVLFWSNGVPSRLPPHLHGLYSLDVMWDWPCQFRKVDGLPSSYCIFGAPWDSAAHMAMLWGDSHAEQLAPLIEAGLDGGDVSILLYGNCPAALGGTVNRQRPELPSYAAACGQKRSSGLAYLKSHPEIDLVVLASSWSRVATTVSASGVPRGQDGTGLIRRGIEEFLSEAETPGRRFLIVADTPVHGLDPIPCVIAGDSGLLRRPCAPGQPGISQAQHDARTAAMTAAFRELASLRNDTEVVLPGEGLCASGACVMRLDGAFLYRDSSHFRRNLQPETRRALADLIGLTAAVRGATGIAAPGSAESAADPGGSPLDTD